MAQLTTTAQVKGAARIPAAVTMWDVRIGEIIADVEADILRQVELSAFPATNYSAYLDTEQGWDLVRLPKWTVYGIVALTQFGGLGDQSPRLLVENTDYVWNEAGIIRLTRGSFDAQRRALHVTYSAGLFPTAGSTPGWASRLATLSAVRQWHQEPLAGLESQNVSPISKRVARPKVDEDAILAEIMRLLAPYVRT